MSFLWGLHGGCVGVVWGLYGEADGPQGWALRSFRASGHDKMGKEESTLQGGPGQGNTESLYDYFKSCR